MSTDQRIPWYAGYVCIVDGHVFSWHETIQAARKAAAIQAGTVLATPGLLDEDWQPISVGDTVRGYAGIAFPAALVPAATSYAGCPSLALVGEE